MASKDFLAPFLSSLPSHLEDWSVLQVLSRSSRSLEDWVYLLVLGDDDIELSIPSGQVVLYFIQSEWSGKWVIRITGAGARVEVRTLVCTSVSGQVESRIVWRLECDDGRFEHTMLVLVPENGTVSAHAIAEVCPGVQRYAVSVHETVIMLGDTWSVRWVPELRIASDNWTASHSATVERVSESILAYMESRWIPESQARGMYIRSKIDSEFSRLPPESRDVLFSGLASHLKI